MAHDPSRPRTPEELLLAYRDRGDAEAIGALFDTTAPHLFHVAQAIAPDAAAAEDALQETYLQALASIDRYDATRPVVPWLVGILRLKVHEVRRRVRRAPDPGRVQMPAPPLEPGDAVASREDEAMVHEALEDLPEPYRNVAILRWRYGLTPAQIAHARDEPPGTVASLLSRAMARLRRSLTGVPAAFFGVRAPRGLDGMRRTVVEAAWAGCAAAAATGAAGLGAAAGAGTGTAILGGALMAKKTIAVLAVAAALLAAVGVRVLSSTAQAPTTRPAAPPRQAALDPRPPATAPDLAGVPHPKDRVVPPTVRDEAPAAGPAAGASVHGVVRDEEGAPVAGATVYALAKGSQGFDDLADHPHAGADPKGRFHLDLPSPQGCWIGAVAPGRLPAFADGDSLDAALDLMIVLKEGPEIAVHAVDMDGRPVPGAMVYVAPARGEGVRGFPAPGGVGGTDSMADTGIDGRARVRAATEGPVEVSLSPPNTMLRTEPESVRLEHPPGEAEFRVVPSCVLSVRVLDATTGRAFEGPFGFSLVKPGSEDGVNGFSTSNPDATGIGELMMGLAPGTYDVKVTAAGRRTERVAAVAFDRPGARREIVASLARAGERTSGSMLLAWSDAGEAGSATPNAPADPDVWGHSVLLRRTAPDPTPWFAPMSAEGFTVLDEVGRTRYDAAHRITTIDLLVPGTYDVLAWHRATERCAFARDVRVPANNSGNARLALRSGVRVRMGDLVGPTASTKGLDLDAEPLGSLPVFRLSPGGWSTFGPEDEIDPAFVLGPYPFETVTATFPGPDGAMKRVVVGSKAPVPAPR